MVQIESISLCVASDLLDIAKQRRSLVIKLGTSVPYRKFVLTWKGADTAWRNWADWPRSPAGGSDLDARGSRNVGAVDDSDMGGAPFEDPNRNAS